MYGGSPSHDRAIDAVAMTRGRVLVYQDRIVPAYYSSCCGGLPATAIDAIGPNVVNGIEPLQGRAADDACREAPVFSWQVERRTGELSERLSASGRRSGQTELRHLKRVSSIRIARRNRHGRPAAYTILDDRGRTVELVRRRSDQRSTTAAAVCGHRGSQ